MIILKGKEGENDVHIVINQFLYVQNMDFKSGFEGLNSHFFEGMFLLKFVLELLGFRAYISFKLSVCTLWIKKQREKKIGHLFDLVKFWTIFIYLFLN